jgi:hypothetical protein
MYLKNRQDSRLGLKWIVIKPIIKRRESFSASSIGWPCALSKKCSHVSFSGKKIARSRLRRNLTWSEKLKTAPTAITKIAIWSDSKWNIPLVIGYICAEPLQVHRWPYQLTWLVFWRVKAEFSPFSFSPNVHARFIMHLYFVRIQRFF